MKILDNITSTVRDDLRVEIKKGSKVSIAAACFSMYAYKELKKQLESVDEFRFIFTSPTFVKEKAEKQKREFYIPRLSRETSLYGTEFEIKLRNEMTQRAIAKECADWIRKKAKFKSNTTGENMAGFMTVDSKTAQTAYMPINGFTTVTSAVSVAITATTWSTAWKLRSPSNICSFLMDCGMIVKRCRMSRTWFWKTSARPMRKILRSSSIL